MAVLAFLSSIFSKDPGKLSQIYTVASSLLWFASGVATGVGALIFAYLTDLHYGNKTNSLIFTWKPPYSEPGPETARLERLTGIFHTLAILFGIASLGLFIIGILRVRDGILLMATS